MRNAFELKGTDFKIFGDLRKELINLRKKRMSSYHEAKKEERKRLLVSPSWINYTSMVSLLFRQ